MTLAYDNTFINFEDDDEPINEIIEGAKERDSQHVSAYLEWAFGYKMKIPIELVQGLLSVNSDNTYYIITTPIDKKYPEEMIKAMIPFLKGKKAPRKINIYKLINESYPNLVKTLLDNDIPPIELRTIFEANLTKDDISKAIKLIKNNNNIKIPFDDVVRASLVKLDDDILKDLILTLAVFDNFINSSQDDIEKAVDYLNERGLLTLIDLTNRTNIFYYVLEKGYNYHIDENTFTSLYRVAKEMNKIDEFIEKIKQSDIKQKDIYFSLTRFDIPEEYFERVLEMSSEKLDLKKKTDVSIFIGLPLSLQKTILKEYDVNTMIDSGDTLLFKAVVRNKTELVRYLLERGADRTIKNKDGLTVKDLVRSVGVDNDPMLQILLMKSRGDCGVHLEEEDVYRLHLHAPGEEICAEALQDHMLAQVAASRDNGQGEKRTVPCYVAACNKRITSDDVYGIVSDDFYRKFYVLADINARPNTGAFNVVLKNKPTGNAGAPTVYGQNYHHSFCPLCLVAEERETGCAYITHQCKDYLVNKELEEKYEARMPLDERGTSQWCVICGRPSVAHRHLTAEGEFAPEKPRPAGVHIHAFCQGGGRAEIFARMLMIKGVLASYTAEQLADKTYENAIAMRNACSAAADVAYKDEALMARGAELAAMEEEERVLEGGARLRLGLRRKGITRKKAQRRR